METQTESDSEQIFGHAHMLVDKVVQTAISEWLVDSLIQLISILGSSADSSVQYYYYATAARKAHFVCHQGK